jgi:HEPN domain-containing protein
MMDWLSEVQAEYEKAENSRAKGNEGQARVCARRAAGIAAREYFTHRGQHPRTSSAYDLLSLITEDSGAPASLREPAARLTLRVNEDFQLPSDVDLLVEARRFCEAVEVTLRE